MVGKRGINAGSVMKALHDLMIEVRSGSTRMDVLMDSMTALESAMTSMIDRVDNLFTTTQELKDQMDKWQSSSLRAHDNRRSVNLRACAGFPQDRDEPRWEEGEASRSSCLRVDDSEEDSELHETPGVSSTDPLTETAGENQYRNYDQDGRDGFTVDDEKTTDIETWVTGKLPTKNQWQFCPHDAGQALWQAAGQRRHQHYRRTSQCGSVGPPSRDSDDWWKGGIQARTLFFGASSPSRSKCEIQINCNANNQ